MYLYSNNITRSYSLSFNDCTLASSNEGVVFNKYVCDIMIDCFWWLYDYYNYTPLPLDKYNKFLLDCLLECIKFFIVQNNQLISKLNKIIVRIFYKILFISCNVKLLTICCCIIWKKTFWHTVFWSFDLGCIKIIFI